MAHSVATASHGIGRGIFDGKNQLVLLRQTVMTADIFLCGIFFGVEGVESSPRSCAQGFSHLP